MTPDQERQLRIQAAKRGYNRQQVESFVQFAKSKEATPKQTETESQPPDNRGPVRKVVDFLVKPAATAVARAGASVYNLGAGIKKATEGDLEGANRELDSPRTLPYVGKVEPLNDPFEGMAAGAEIGLTVLGPKGATTGAKATGRAAAKGTESVFERLLPGLSRKLEEANLRLTPVQKDRLGKELGEVTEYLSSKRIVGSPEARYNQISRVYHQTENELQTFLTKEAATKTVPKSSLIKQLEELKTSFAAERDVLAIEKQIDGAIRTLQIRYPNNISLARLNQLKRSTYQNAYNKAGDKVLDEVEHDIGDILRRNIEKATEDLKIGDKALSAFNQEYGTLIKARKLLRIAKTRKQVGLVGRLIAAAMGGSIGTTLGPGIGTAFGILAGERAAEAVAGTATKSAMGAAARRAAEAGQRLLRRRRALPN